MTRSWSYSRPDADASHHPPPQGMLPLFLNDLVNHQDFVELTLELDNDSLMLRSIAPAPPPPPPPPDPLPDDSLLSITARIRTKFPWLRSASSRASTASSLDRDDTAAVPMSARDARRLNAQLQRTRSSAQAALRGLRFISNTTGASDANELWRRVQSRFHSLAQGGLLARDDFAECIGMMDSKEFALRIFDALARRKGLRISKINVEELHEFWLKISDQSFDARLQIFFDMADSNEDGRITRDEVQELIMLSASANNLARLKERAEEYASLIMEELDPENLGYIELWQLETLLLQRDTYMNYSRPLSTATSVGWSQNLSSFNPKTIIKSATTTLHSVILQNWQRIWILFLWGSTMAALFVWKFLQYKNRAAFNIMGYCLPTAKGAAETLKFNMALILLPVCRNTLTWLRSTAARSVVPFDDNINFHKLIACFIAVGIVVHGGVHLACDFPRLARSSPEEFEVISSDFHNKKPSYKELLMSVEGVTGIVMVVLMGISFTLATHRFRRNVVKLPWLLNRLAGFNAFWYSHHLMGIVYLLLLVHGTFLFLAHSWTQKTTWVYIVFPLLLYLGERSLRACRSEYYSVEILKVSVLPGNVFSLVMLKPRGFKYRSGQYIFLQCPSISQFEWHPFSITSAPGDEYLSVHIRTVGDWTRELKRVFTDHVNSKPVLARAKLGHLVNMERKSQPRLLLDGPYGAPAQDYQNYDVLLLVGLGIGATPFVSILKDLLNNSRTIEEHTPTESTTETSRSEDSFGSLNTTPSGKRKLQSRTGTGQAQAYFYWVTREAGSLEWFKGVMDEVAEMDRKGQIELHNYLTSVYEESDARSTLITMVQALNHAKHGVDILSGTRARTHFARPDWKEVFGRIASKHAYKTVGVFYCGMPMLAKELKRLSLEFTRKTATRFEFHKEYF
ncbi:Respiratory burst oxidase-like protein E, partial [Cucurbita argyrosperma subsp. argyrosperma]